MPKMSGGLVVAPYDESFKYCHYCGTPLEWREKYEQFSPYTGKPLIYKTYGCPNYGSNKVGDWHDFWWEDLFDIIKEDITSSLEQK